MSGGLGAINREKPDLALLDLSMPHANGIEVFTEARRWSPDTKFVLFTGQIAGAAAAAMAGAGVGGVFLKTGDPGDLIAALPRIMAGRQVIAPAVQALIDAAEALRISAKTLDKHRTNLMRKLGAHSTAGLAMTAVRLGLIDAG